MKWLTYILVVILLIAELAVYAEEAITETSAEKSPDTMLPSTVTNITMTEWRSCSIILLPTPYDRWMYRDSTGEVSAQCRVETLEFTWNPTTDDISGVVSYQVRLFSAEFTDIGNVTSYRFAIGCCSDLFPDRRIINTFEVRAVDKAGNQGIPASLTFALDTMSPMIMELGISNVTETSAVITWTTDEPSYGSLAYWWGTPFWNESAHAFVDAPGLSENHTITLTGLEKGTTYHFRVKAIDESENRAWSPEIFFTTPEK
jgi:hypothetical protein